MTLEDSTFLLFAARHYDNPQCHDIEEFEEDLKRIQYLRKLLNRYTTSGELKERLILNHLIILYNCFGAKATDMLFMKLEDFHPQLKAFVEFLNFMPERVTYNNKVIYSASIKADARITEALVRV